MSNDSEKRGDLKLNVAELPWRVGIKTGHNEYSLQAAFSAEALADAYVTSLQLRHPELRDAFVIIAPMGEFRKARKESPESEA